MKQTSATDLPQLFPLADSDCFALALDRLIRNSGLAGSICRLTLRLDGPLELERLESLIAGSALVNWLGRVHYVKRPPAGLSKYFTCNAEARVAITHRSETDEGEGVQGGTSAQALDPTRAPGLAFELLDHLDGSTSVSLTWHHVLMDALGAEFLFQHIDRCSDGRAQEDSLAALIQPAKPVSIPRFLLRFPWQAYLGRRAVRFVATRCCQPVVSLARTCATSGARSSPSTLLCYEEATTSQIDDHAQRIGASLHRGLFYLAATIRAFEEIVRSRGEADGAYVVPIPQDLRRRGGHGPVFGNRHTFQFYRVERSEADSLQTIYELLKLQMVDQLRRGIPGRYEEMMGLFRYIPVGLYARALQGPTKGQVSSFFYAFTGDSGPEMEQFLGVPVRTIHHLPPVAGPPGVSVVFSRHRKRLYVSLSLLEGCLDDDELASFRQTLRAELLGESDR